MDTEEIKQSLKPRPRKLQVPTKDLLSSGSTVLNLACSGKVQGAFAKGYYYYFVGDSSSGKSFFMGSVLAEASINPAFKDHRLLYDDVENGMLFDVRRFFGPKLHDRLERCHSVYLEDAYDAVETAIKEGPCICILDSLDALQARSEAKKDSANKRAREKGAEEKGSYGTAKAKISSSRLREITNLLPSNGSILFIVSQTRENIGFGAQFNPKTKAGGLAPTFYATLELWTSVKENITKSILGKNRQQGIVTKVKVKKNRHIGGVRFAEVPILWSFGIDDSGSCVDFLVDEKHWSTSKKGIINAAEFELELTREKLITRLEETNQVGELRELVAEVWGKIEQASQIQRQSRYE